MNLVLIPGFMLDHSLWRDMDIALHDLGNVHYGDLAHGDTLEAMALHNLAHAPDQFVLIGFSLGGYVARYMVSIAPERITALILIASSMRDDDAAQKRSKAASAKAIQAASYAGLSASAIRASVHPSRQQDHALIEHIRKMSIQLGADTFRRQLLLDRENIPVLARLSEFPVLIVAAAQDQLRSLAEAKDLQQQFSHADLNIIADSGHMIPLEQGDALSKRIETWLGNHVLHC
ncbi:pimeloyl-ACP methyl ester carboxylesterase [Acinetobacter calcoaceticus]|uniref:Pimeloyl-ACP methyl ester carboxylesterase n=1 Tax=Acinetobacter calcoaceticus TaxID=471 RepID=A0A4R1XYA3_ACICA|nr:pimeloyl-ACP methyl ester carboxylesterase [Acinetobacter calcoaceticus]